MAMHRMVTCTVCGIRRKQYTDSAEDGPCRECARHVEAMLNPPGEWTQRALCVQVDPEAFFPRPNETTQIEASRRVCQQCEVRVECLDYALQIDEPHGIWGGLTPHERRRLKKKGSAA